MKLPNAQPVQAELVARIVEYVGRDRLAKALHVRDEHVDRWLRDGVEHGPTAACFRYLAADLAVPTNTVGTCVLCGGHATEVVAQTPVCTSCSSPSMEKLRALGMSYSERYTHHETIGVGEPAQRRLSYVAVSATRAFEQPMLVKFSAQSRIVLFRQDPEIGDETFDKAVWIETDDYEAVFESFQLMRRRQLVYNLTRTGVVRLDVNEVVYEGGLAAREDPWVPVQVVLLGWSLLYETSNAWAFE